MTEQSPTERRPSFAEVRAIALRTARLFRPYRRRIGVVALAILVSSGLSVANPLLVRAIFDHALFPPGGGGANLHLLLELVAGLLAVAAASSGIGVLQTYLATRIGQSVMRDLRGSLYGSLKRMPLRFFTDTRVGEIQSRLTNDVNEIDEVVTHVAQDSLANVVVVASSLAAMLVMSWRLTLLTFCVVPLFAWLTHRTGAAGHQKWKAVQEARADMTALAEETLSVSGVLLSKIFGRDAGDVRRFRELNERLTALQTRARVNGRIFWALVGICFAAGPAGVFLVAALSLRHGDGITAGTIVAFTTLQARLFWPIGELFHYVIELRSSFAMLERIFAYVDLEPELTERPGARALAPAGVRGRVELDGVTFRYPGAERPALEEVSLRIEPGQLAALVGPTGAGKTTLSYLVARLYDPDAGAVLLDGHDVRGLTLDSLTGAMAMVTQETYLFHDTVRANLLYAAPEADEAALEAAARAAYVHERILELPQGYETVVGERGYRLSGGEKQRLAIARAVLRDPRILVLDEATSALDTASERIVQRALGPLMAGRTTIAIAHRLSTVLAADVIFVVERGRVVERGPHAELVELGGLYARLYGEQFSGGAVEAVCEDGVVLAGGAVVRTG